MSNVYMKDARLRDYGTMTCDYDNDHSNQGLKFQHSCGSGHGQKVPCPEVKRYNSLILSQFLMTKNALIFPNKKLSTPLAGQHSLSLLCNVTRQTSSQFIINTLRNKIGVQKRLARHLPYNMLLTWKKTSR